MAGFSIAVRPFFGSALAKIASLSGRNIRLTVLICVIAIGGSFAAAGALQFRFETANAARQSATFQSQRAADVAAVVTDTLERQRRAGRDFARGELFSLPPDVRGVTVADAAGKVTVAAGEPIAMTDLVGLAVDKPAVIGDAHHTLIVFRDGIDFIAVSFRSVLPQALQTDLQITGTGGRTLAGAPLSGETIVVAAGRWPVQVRVPAQSQAALSAWYGTLPLYLFVILGPALVGAWLAAVFVREFERRAKSAAAIRSLRSTRPDEGRLLVRLANAERAAAEAHRSKSEFIAHMSHELRTPLNAVIGFAEVIERGFFGPVGHKKYVEYARDIGMAGRALHTKVGDILEFADIEAGRYPLNAAPFDIVSLVGACVAENGGRAFSRQIALVMLPADVSPVIGDAMAVRRIVTNLLANALTYTPDHGKVTVSVSEDDGAVAVAVSDSGGGFSAGEQAAAGRAFRRFERDGVSTGTGLGLAIVVALARRMGGALRLDSTPGQGTTAELRLPKAG
jgi:signal transduction histidine kinase